VYGPRFDYNPSTLVAQGLLIEEQRTNSLTYSEQFDNAAWTKSNSSITANAATAPDGTLTGDKLIGNSGLNGAVSQSISFTSGTSYAVSFFAQKAEFDIVQLRVGSSAFAGTTGNRTVDFNLTTGSVSSVGSSISSASITAVGNGWYRCVSIVIPTSTASDSVFIRISNTGDGYSGIYIWGAQLEAGAFATSYIPTTTAATTRSADIASIGTLSPWYNATEGTLFTEGTVVNNISGTTARVFGYFADSGVTNLFSVEARSATSTRARILTGGVTVNASDTIDVLGVNAKLAGAYGSDGATICVNGRSPVTAASSLPTGIAALYLGQNSVPTAASIANGHIRRITYTPRRLTNAELQSLTS
jgi:hypothetical protein